MKEITLKTLSLNQSRLSVNNVPQNRMKNLALYKTFHPNCTKHFQILVKDRYDSGKKIDMILVKDRYDPGKR